MDEDKRMEGVLTMGLDLGDRHSHFCLLDAAGAVMEEGRVVTTVEGFGGRFGSCKPVRIALEAGTHSPWVSRMLTGFGHEVLVANPRKLRMIYTDDSKSDKMDAERLARVARVDPKLLSPIQHRGQQTRTDLGVLRSRDAMVSVRTQLINHVRGAVKSTGSRLPSCSTGSFHKQVAEQLPAILRETLLPIVEIIGTLSQRIRDYDKRIEEMAQKQYPQAQVLSQVPGVGPLTSVAYILTLEDPHRFKSSRAVGSYLGLRPRQADSGSREPQLRITKAGDPFLRRLLVGSAQYILGPFGADTDLRRWGLALAKRGGKSAKRRAVVAVARKLAVLLHRLWVTGQVYEPLRTKVSEKA